MKVYGAEIGTRCFYLDSFKNGLKKLRHTLTSRKKSIIYLSIF